MPLGDGFAILLLLALTLAAVGPGLRQPGELAKGDVQALWLPLYSFMGERLRAGDLPGWNPHQFAGTPFAGDPNSGWAYLPAMLLFTVMAPAMAVVGLAVFHLVLGGLTTYVLARVLGIGIVGSIVAGAAYEFSGFIVRSRCCYALTGLGAWLPLMFLGAELALRSRTWAGRVGGWGVAGLAVSQTLATWLGQGSYYGLLALGGYVAYRTVVAPVVQPRSLPARLRDLVVNGAGILLISFGLAAIGLLPRLEINPETNLAGGIYRGAAASAQVTVGWPPIQVAHDVFGGYLDDPRWYVGGGAVALALVGAVVAWRRTGVPYFVLLSIGALVLSFANTTPLHALLYALLPRFEDIHRHYPHRVIVVLPLGIALLAAAGVDSLQPGMRRRGVLALAALLPVVVALSGLRWGGEMAVSRTTLLVVVVVAAVLLVSALVPMPLVLRAAPIVLVLLVLWEPTGRWLSAAQWGSDERMDRIGGPAVDLAAYLEPTGAAAFLAQAGPGAARYVGYDPGLFRQVPQRAGRTRGAPVRTGYHSSRTDPMASELLVNNRASLFGLEDAQGYVTVHLARYEEFIAALNGAEQEYHEANILSSGLDSPLLDLLSVRYIVIPMDIPGKRRDLKQLVRDLPTAYEDAQVRVLENDEALPRAWLVHEAQQVARGEALPPLASGAVDPRRMALLEASLPPLGEPGDPAADSASIVDYEPDRMRLEVQTDAPGLLVLSEVYDPAWQATIDGTATEVYVANHALRAVAVPAGKHMVELHYAPQWFPVGIAVSVALYVALVSLGGLALWRKVARRPPPGVGEQASDVVS